MRISNLQAFLRSLTPALHSLGLNAAGQPGVTGGLEALAAALEPFGEWEAEQLAEWLKVAQTYRDTGVVPEPTAQARPKTRKPAAPKAPKAPARPVAEIVAHLRDLQGRQEAPDPAHVKQEVDALGTLTVPQLKEVHKEFLSVVVGKTKPELLAAIRKRINDHHFSRDRVAGIRA